MVRRVERQEHQMGLQTEVPHMVKAFQMEAENLLGESNSLQKVDLPSVLLLSSSQSPESFGW